MGGDLQPRFTQLKYYHSWRMTNLKIIQVKISIHFAKVAAGSLCFYHDPLFIFNVTLKATIFFFSSTVVAEVVFSHTPNYPDEPPLMKARSVRGLSDADIALLQAVLDEQVEENMGMPMIYQLITAAQEWITDKGSSLSAPIFDPEVEEKRRREAEEARIAELRRHGTPVTPENFNEWKVKFDAEMALAKASMQDTAVVAVKGKMSGKAWFLQQEAQHIAIEEPDLEEDEEDGEGSRSDWSGEDPRDYFGKELLEDGDDFPDVDDEDDDDDILNAYLAGT